MRDDRRRPCRLTDAGIDGHAHVSAATTMGVILRAVWRLDVGIGLVVVSVLLFVIGSRMTGRAAASGAVFGAAMVVLLTGLQGLTLGVLTRRSREPGMGESLVRQRRAETCCVACGYSLGSLAPEPDGCRVCPECGAAWKAASTPESSS